jgi:hypothetical protein
MPPHPAQCFDFKLSVSRLKCQILLILHLATVLACWLNPISWVYSLIFSLILLYSWHYQYRSCSSEACNLRYTDNHGWCVCLANNATFIPVQMQKSSTVSPLLTILHFIIENQPKSYVIFNDAMSVDEYRRLSVLLRTSVHIREL